ncbi:chaperonin 10-like protein [Irpex rosettiformis]|uniref:Chaperonin 10-like protein n=1 Tax=Irpex rosettiformis TaxID=378272 RepID=A0ACB8UBM8_9APHY|nr:chaperonin 10-like protein [Irpex rosettiformis]
MSSHHAIAIVSPGVIDQIDFPTSTPIGNEVLIKVQYTAIVTVDTYQIDRAFYVQGYPHTLGFASAGQVKAVGPEVKNLKAGDKVAAYNFPAPKTKGLQEYALVPQPLVAKVPDDYNLAEAASIPDNYTTAAFTLFGSSNLALPLPTSFPPPSPPSDASQPILVHGGAASSGQYIIQLLHLAGYTQIYATASPKNHAYLKELGATQVFDYHSPHLADEILKATNGHKVSIAIDTIGAKPSIEAYSPVLGKESRLALLLPVKKGAAVRNEEQDDMSSVLPPWVYELVGGATVFPIATFRMFERQDPATLDFMPKLLPQLLASKALRPNRIRLFKESDGPILERVKTALDLHRENKVSGEKIVIELKWN